MLVIMRIVMNRFLCPEQVYACSGFARPLRFVHINVVDQFVQHLFGQRPHFHELAYRMDELFPLVFLFAHFGQLPAQLQNLLLQLLTLIGIFLRKNTVVILRGLAAELVLIKRFQQLGMISILRWFSRSFQRIQHIPPTRTRSRSPCIFQKPQQRRLHIFAAIAENRHTADEEGQAHPPSPVTKLNSWRMYIDESNWDRAAHR